LAIGLKKNGFSYNLYTVEKEQKPISEATGKPVDQRKPTKDDQPLQLPPFGS